ncbi:MAG TPA: HD domain-containing phosphohydrolase [Thermoanaerobaculia bacterium]|nr:HD domain-containing phosphohydrolase [Thermoanaerobaculia bacterium]
MNQLVIRIVAAVNARTLYPASHPRVRAAIAQMIESLRRLIEERNSDSITFLAIGDDLVVDQEIVRKPTLSHTQLIQMLTRRGVERLTLAAGIDEGEADRFITSLATGDALAGSPHVILGRVHVATAEAGSGGGGGERSELSSGEIEVVREAFARFRTDRRLPINAMEQLVWGFVDSLSRTTRAILPLAKLKEHDEYTFIHSVNVSLLVLALARSLGIRGSMLHAFGLAALLHDIGKMMVPLEVLMKPGKLDQDQWAVMQTHTQQGAWYLGTMEGSSPLSITVAYEHHLRYDGQPNYPKLHMPRFPNLASRMTAIADAYDALSTLRPYQQPIMRAAALQILRDRAGNAYDPMLVAEFVRLVTQSPAETRTQRSN